jgi:hypothetical protein
MTVVVLCCDEARRLISIDAVISLMMVVLDGYALNW